MIYNFFLRSLIVSLFSFFFFKFGTYVYIHPNTDCAELLLKDCRWMGRDGTSEDNVRDSRLVNDHQYTFVCQQFKARDAEGRSRRVCPFRNDMKVSTKCLPFIWYKALQVERVNFNNRGWALLRELAS